jgi:antitoxin ParD1/3/4
LPIFGVHAVYGLCSSQDRDAMTLNINLPPQLEEMVRRKVASGMYASASEVVREALRLLDEYERTRAARLEQLRADIEEGLASGDPVPWAAGEFKQMARK